MRPPRFDINQDFSWIFFGCLLVVLFLVVAAIVVANV